MYLQGDEDADDAQHGPSDQEPERVRAVGAVQQLLDDQKA